MIEKHYFLSSDNYFDDKAASPEVLHFKECALYISRRFTELVRSLSGISGVIPSNVISTRRHQKEGVIEFGYLTKSFYSYIYKLLGIQIDDFLTFIFKSACIIVVTVSSALPSPQPLPILYNSLHSTTILLLITYHYRMLASDCICCHVSQYTV